MLRRMYVLLDRVYMLHIWSPLGMMFSIGFEISEHRSQHLCTFWLLLWNALLRGWGYIAVFMLYFSQTSMVAYLPLSIDALVMTTARDYNVLIVILQLFNPKEKNVFLLPFYKDTHYSFTCPWLFSELSHKYFPKESL